MLIIFTISVHKSQYKIVQQIGHLIRYQYTETFTGSGLANAFNAKKIPIYNQPKDYSKNSDHELSSAKSLIPSRSNSRVAKWGLGTYNPKIWSA